MKLIYKITFLFFIIATVVMLIGAYFTFNAVSKEIQKEERFFLKERLQSLSKRLEHRPLRRDRLLSDKMIIQRVNDGMEEKDIVFSDTLVRHATLDRVEPHTKLEVVKKIKDNTYKIILFDLIVEEDDVVDAVKDSMTKTYLLLLVLSLLLFISLSYVVFKPFRSLLDAIKNFSIRDNAFVELPNPSTTEFKQLTEFVGEMMLKSQQDYQSLKEYSENLSHEMQTPIAISKGKLELLMDDDNLTEQQLIAIQSATHSLSGLSNLATSLGLLTKIDNQEFSNVHSVDISQLIKKLLAHFDELIALKSIRLDVEMRDNVFIDGNEHLVEILLTNLLTNAIKHNTEKGYIAVKLENDFLQIKNSGLELKLTPEKLFERFVKQSQTNDSSGLGLSIAKKICDNSTFNISYRHDGQEHLVTVKW